MDEISEAKQKATELRKSKNFKDALPIYRVLWEKTSDSFDGAGLLSCLRNLKQYDEALELAPKVMEKHGSDNWCKLEAIWTYIKAELSRFPEDTPLETVLNSTQKIMILNPEGLALKSIVFKVLKFVKKNNRWEMAGNWIEKIDPESLEEKPIAEDFGPRGWSYKVLWYNYKLKYLLEINEFEKVVKLADEIVGKFPNQRKYILRNKAIALQALENSKEAVAIYEELIKGFKPDWWLLREYALAIKDKKTESLNLLIRAADSHSKLEMMVSLFDDIGMTLLELTRKEDALPHFLLSKLVREKNGWKVSSEILNIITKIDTNSEFQSKHSSIRETHAICKSVWAKELGQQGLSAQGDRKMKKGLRGVIRLGTTEKHFCFIHCLNKETYFCNKSNLPPESKEGETVIFDAIPSFDEKKQKASWKAVNVRKEK